MSTNYKKLERDCNGRFVKRDGAVTKGKRGKNTKNGQTVDNFIIKAQDQQPTHQQQTTLHAHNSYNDNDINSGGNNTGQPSLWVQQSPTRYPNSNNQYNYTQYAPNQYNQNGGYGY